MIIAFIFCTVVLRFHQPWLTDQVWIDKQFLGHICQLPPKFMGEQPDPKKDCSVTYVATEIYDLIWK